MSGTQPYHWENLDDEPLCAHLRNNAVAIACRRYPVILLMWPETRDGPPLSATRGHPFERTQTLSPTNQLRITRPLHCWRACDVSRVFGLGKETPVARSGA